MKKEQILKLSNIVFLSVFLFVFSSNLKVSSKEFFDIHKKTNIEYKPIVGKNGGTLTLTNFSEPKTFNLYLATEASSNDILGQMYEGLSYMDPFTKTVKPALAESWTISDDKTTYTIKMKKGLKWSDGEPITADDVVFTYNDIINNLDIPTNSREGLLVDDKFPTVTKIDDLTVKFVTAKPFVPFYKNGGFGLALMPKHILEKLVKKDSSGKVPFNQWGDLNADPKTIVCNGPFKLKEYVEGEKVVLEKNPYYWRKDEKGNQLPYLDQFVVEKVLDSNESVIDVINNNSDGLMISHYDYKFINKKNDILNFYNLGADDGILFFIFNQSTAKNNEGNQIVDPIKASWFRNVKFRQAISSLVDRNKMIKNIYDNFAQPNFSSISMQNPYYNSNVKKYDYNIKRANKLLNEAGFKKDKNGNLLDSKGNKVEFNLNTNIGNYARDSIANIFVDTLKSVGIKVNYKPIQFNTLVQKIDETLDWDCIIVGLTGSSTDPHGGINTWRLSGRMHMFNMGNAEQNKAWKGKETSYQKYETEIYDLFNKASKEFNESKRKELYFNAQKIEAENLPFIYIASKDAIITVNKRLGNIFPNISGGNGSNTFVWNSFEIYLKN